ncbi:MAG: FAD-binding protein [Saprospiraceae bacterium]|nr:FAD-binding protein [Saprospiraceae bacterium]
MSEKLQQPLANLSEHLQGELFYDSLMRTLYATDASVYRELPLAVALPKGLEDLKTLIGFALEQGVSLIPRTAGTSLAGQCVGEGIVVDVSKYFTKILELNADEGWVRVQPGVIRDELNAFLKPHGFWFGPNTSTANRCMIGGMVGNNSCGSTSIVYGSTRDHVISLNTLLSDGNEVQFTTLSQEEFQGKLREEGLEGEVYRQVKSELEQSKLQNSIRAEFPKSSIQRRNTGYAVDILLDTEQFTPGGEAFNFCKLLCGSEGTLAFTTEVKLHIDPLPEPHDIVVAAHFHSIDESLRATQLTMQFEPTACELMDKVILDCTKDNIEQSKNRFFVEGDPAAILTIEFRGKEAKEAEAKADTLIQALQEKGYGYAYPKVHPPHTSSVWELRKAGLGLLANIPGDKKAVACIEDTAVAIADLADYIADFSKIMEGFGQRSVYYAHAGAGEIHLRPILDLKKSEDVQQFYDISKASAELVKSYQGSLSGEHGDGRVRAAFIPLMVGEENYALFRRIKQTWDPNGIFNPGKIVDAQPMNTSLRYELDREEPEIATLMDFSETGGILRLAEKCNGSGDCRKLPLSGGTMCPSYQATRNEKDTTRARANTLREFLTKDSQPNPFDHPEIYEVMDLCLSCKGCTSECPSNVDMSSLKAEFLHQYYQSHGIPLRAKAFANINSINKLGAKMPGITNFFLRNKLTSALVKSSLGIAPERSLPVLGKTSLRQWLQRTYAKWESPKSVQGEVYLFCDEFTNYNDPTIGIRSVELLHQLGYQVRWIEHAESGRAHLSKGLLSQAKGFAEQNIDLFKSLISEDIPLIGIEPSAILSFRDEYPRLVAKSEQSAARRLASNTLLIDEFLYREVQAGRIQPAQFTTSAQHILLHGHCHQKALADLGETAQLLSLPEKYTVEVIPSGCCGMAGSFGYEKEHYEVSMKIGGMVLFPAVKGANPATIIAAPGTSCRHQIADGTQRKALHPVEVLWQALKSEP